MKEIKYKDINHRYTGITGWKDQESSLILRYKCYTNPVKICLCIFIDLDWLILKFIRKRKVTIYLLRQGLTTCLCHLCDEVKTVDHHSEELESPA